jgi:glc operon protein GlcG
MAQAAKRTFSDSGTSSPRRNAILKLPGAMPVEGGLPLTVEGKIIGALGCSGGTSQQDGVVAKADALARMASH